MHPSGHLSLVSGSVWIRIRLSYAWNRFGSLVQGFLHRLARFFYVSTSLNALEHVISCQFCCALSSFSLPCTWFVLCIWTYISCWDISYGILHCEGVWVEFYLWLRIWMITFLHYILSLFWSNYPFFLNWIADIFFQFSHNILTLVSSIR